MIWKTIRTVRIVTYRAVSVDGNTKKLLYCHTDSIPLTRNLRIRDGVSQGEYEKPLLQEFPKKIRSAYAIALRARRMSIGVPTTKQRLFIAFRDHERFHQPHVRLLHVFGPLSDHVIAELRGKPRHRIL